MGDASLRAGAGTPRGDPFEAYPPPFDIASDMLLAAATCPIGPLRAAHPDVPFLAVAGRALLGIWFASILDIVAGRGERFSIGPLAEPEDIPYRELNVAVLLRGRRLFVPGIYATGELSVRLGHRYGMPKQRIRMDYEASGGVVRSRAEVHGAESLVTARPVPAGHLLGSIPERTLPWWSWPVYFPGGSRVEALVEGAGEARAAWITEGRLALNEPWLPRPVPLWRFALHVPRQRMKLPAPGPEGGVAPAPR